MELSEALRQLGELHARGVLSDDEFAQAKSRVLRGGADEAQGMQAINALRRSRDDNWLGGVCGGIARITGVQAWAWRLMFALLALFAGTGMLVYLLLWLLVPIEPLPAGPAHRQAQAG
jgi:phage shock protein PspC (stress-responsive transcriptional regulator)